MDTQSLKAFLAVAQTSSFSQAAEQLHLTQPAISKRIAVLETQVGSRLFDRIGRRINLTEAGRLLMPRAHQILAMFDDTRRALSNLQGDVQGSLVLATSHHVGLHRLPPLLKHFTGKHPAVRLDMRFLDSEKAYAGVLSGDLELGIVTMSPAPNPALVSVPVWTDRLRFVCARDHPLATQTVSQLADLSHYPAVLPGEMTFTRGIVMESFARQKLNIDVAMSTNYLETLKMMVTIGLGWSVMPDTMINDDMIVLPLDHPPIERPLGYLFHRHRTLSNAARAMIELLEQERQSLYPTDKTQQSA